MGLCPFFKKTLDTLLVFADKDMKSYNYKENTIRVNIKIREIYQFFPNYFKPNGLNTHKRRNTKDSCGTSNCFWRQPYQYSGHLTGKMSNPNQIDSN